MAWEEPLSAAVPSTPGLQNVSEDTASSTSSATEVTDSPAELEGQNSLVVSTLNTTLSVPTWRITHYSENVENSAKEISEASENTENCKKDDNG